MRLRSRCALLLARLQARVALSAWRLALLLPRLLDLHLCSLALQQVPKRALLLSRVRVRAMPLVERCCLWALGRLGSAAVLARPVVRCVRWLARVPQAWVVECVCRLLWKPISNKTAPV